MISTSHLEKSPLLPRLLSAPCKLIPSAIHSHILVAFLNRLLSEQLAEGELNFLLNKRLCVTVNDANIHYFISLKQIRTNNSKIISVVAENKNDIEIKASVYDYLQLAARQQDPDTLVFQRRLIMQGNTELGLEIKNFLDGLDLESSTIFSKIETLLQKSLPVYRRLFN